MMTHYFHSFQLPAERSLIVFQQREDEDPLLISTISVKAKPKLF